MKHPDKSLRLAAAVCLTLLWSCADDPLSSPGSTSDTKIKFTSSLADTDDDNVSRAPGSNYSDFRAEKFADRELYLVSVVSPGIDAKRLASYDPQYDDIDLTDGPISRASVVTASNLGTLYGGKHVNLFAYAYPTATSYNGKGTSAYTFSDVLTAGADIKQYIADEDLTIGTTQASDGTFALTPENNHFWLSDDYRLTFFALFPSKTDYSSSNYSLSFTGNTPKLTCTVESDVANHKDYLYAQANTAGSGSGKTDNATVNFSMKHIMAGVGLTLGTGFDATNDVITSVSFTNVNVSGTFNLASGEWDTSTYSLGDRSFSCTSAEGKNSINSDNGTLFIFVPQTCPSSAIMSFTVYNKTNGTTSNFSTTIANHTWIMGKTVNYTISTDPSITEYYITTEYDTMYFSWNGSAAGAGTARPDGISDAAMIRVKSWKAVTKGSGTTYTAMPWTASVTTNAGYVNTYSSSSSGLEINSMSTDAVDAASYSSSDTDYKFETQKYNFYMKPTLKAQTAGTKKSDEAATIESQANVIGNGTTYVDLSNYKQSTSTGYPNFGTWSTYTMPSNTSVTTTTYANSRCTSNCYMIEYPGYYSIPTVYGNAVYGNHNNELSFNNFTSTSSDYQSLDCFISGYNKYEYDMKGNWINSTSDANPGYAKLVWQDVKGVITEVSYNNNSVRFKIQSGNIKPCNAVLAVMDSSSGHILWSWHIWVTPHAYDASNNNLTYYDPNTLAGSIGVQKMLVRPLGFIEGDWKTYAERTSTLTLTQDTSGKTCTVNLVQKYHQFQSNSCCYYQWGRKDPFPGCDNVETGVMNYYGDYTITSTPRPIYDINGNTVSITHSSADRTLYNCINNPSTFYTTASEGSCRIPTGRNYYNLWGCTFSSSDIEDGQLVSKLNVSWGLAGVSGARKTVYDPCPPGYRVPPILYMPAVTYDGWNHGTATNKWVASANTEADLYKNVVNTSYSNHDQVINSGYFDLYESKMTAYGAKPGGNSYRLYAMGYKATDGNFQGYGGLARYWSASSWAASTGTTNHRVFQIYFYYGSGTTDFHAVDGNTEYYGNPVMAMCDPAMPCW